MLNVKDNDGITVSYFISGPSKTDSNDEQVSQGKMSRIMMGSL